jgi:CheY-like chemotaxis protein
MAKCSILIIDDDEDDVEILSEALTKSGIESIHTVHTAMQAFMFLQTIECKEELPNLIVTDLYLPGIRGDQFLNDLKVMPKYSHIPVIVLSTEKSEKEIERYRQMGALEYLVKPSTYVEYFAVAKNISKRIL